MFNKQDSRAEGKASMVTSLHFIELSERILLLYDRQNRIYIAELTPLHCQDSQPHLKLCWMNGAPLDIELPI